MAMFDGFNGVLCGVVVQEIIARVIDVIIAILLVRLFVVIGWLCLWFG